MEMNGTSPNWQDLAGLLYGDGFFDTMAVWQGAIQLWQFHQVKLKQTAQVLGVELPTQVLDALPGCVPGQEGVLRVFAVAQGMGEPHRWLATFTEQPLQLSVGPISVSMASRTLDAEDHAHRYKLLSRFTYRQAQREATGDDAVMLNKEGRVASFTSACVVYGTDVGVFCIPAHEGRQNAATLQLLQVSYGVVDKPLDAAFPGVIWMLAVNSLRLRVVERVEGMRLAPPDGLVLSKYLQHWPWQQMP